MRHVLVACVYLFFGFTGAAHAASVYVQYASPSLPNTLIEDPLFATATKPGIFIEADLVGSASGATFKGFAFHDGSSAIASVAYSGILSPLRLTNVGVAPVAFGGASFPFFAVVTASFTGTAGGPDGSIGNQLHAIFQVDDPSCGCARIAQVAYQYGEGWNGGVLSGVNLNAIPSVSNGGTVSISTASRSTLVATLWMPVILLAPGQSAVVYFSFLPVAVAAGAGFNATTDASHSARLRLFVPAGSSITTDAGPLPWITVPEPSVGLMLGAGILGVVAFGRRAKKPARLERRLTGGSSVAFEAPVPDPNASLMLSIISRVLGSAISSSGSVIALLVLALTPLPAAAAATFQIQLGTSASAFDAGFDNDFPAATDTGPVPIGVLPYSLTESQVATAAMGVASGRGLANGMANMAAPGTFVGIKLHAMVSAAAGARIVPLNATTGFGEAGLFMVYTDELTAGGPGIAVGTPISLRVNVLLKGLMSLATSPPRSPAHNYAQFNFGDAGLGADPIDPLACRDLDGPCALADTGTLIVLAGIPFQVQASLLLQANATADSTPNVAGASGDFLSTAQLFIDVLTPGATYTLASGGDLRSVPEPGVGLTTLIGFIALAMLHHRQAPPPLAPR